MCYRQPISAILQNAVSNLFSWTIRYWTFHFRGWSKQIWRPWKMHWRHPLWTMLAIHLQKAPWENWRSTCCRWMPSHSKDASLVICLKVFDAVYRCGMSQGTFLASIKRNPSWIPIARIANDILSLSGLQLEASKLKKGLVESTFVTCYCTGIVHCLSPIQH